jgi:DNA-entry nuclease
LKKRTIRKTITIIIALVVVLTGGYFIEDNYFDKGISVKSISIEGLDSIPEYSSYPYVYIGSGNSDLLETEEWSEGYESYTMDDLGRCSVAEAMVGEDTMPTDDREDISSVEPTGWNNKRYDSELVDGGWIYNRCHLIGYQLTGENDNADNLITGTRYLNIEGMLPFENEVADYVRDTGNHVMYQVTPIYEGDNQVASGVVMEAESVEDNGEGIDFNVYCYNVQPGIEIDYNTGNNWLAEE